MTNTKKKAININKYFFYLINTNYNLNIKKRGENPVGYWTLRVTDKVKNNNYGRLYSWYMTINGQLKDRIENQNSRNNLGNFKRDAIDIEENISNDPVTLSKREAMIETIKQYKTPMSYLTLAIFSIACVCSIMFIRKLRKEKTIDKSLEENEVSQMTTYLTL